MLLFLIEDIHVNKLKLKMWKCSRVNFNLSPSQVFVITITLITFCLHVTSVSIDQWMVIHRGDSERTYLGIFYVYDADSAGYRKIMEANVFVQKRLYADKLEDPNWVHMSRFVIVCALLIIGFAVITTFSCIILSHDFWSSPMVMNIASGVFMLIALCVTLPEGKAKISYQFHWGSSYIMTWVTSVLSMILSMCWIAWRHIQAKRKKETLELLIQSLHNTIY